MGSRARAVESGETLARRRAAQSSACSSRSLPQNTSPSPATRQGAPTMPISAAREHSALSSRFVRRRFRRARTSPRDRRRTWRARSRASPDRRSTSRGRIQPCRPDARMLPRLALKGQSDPRGEQARLRKGGRTLERDAHGLAGPLDVTPHVATLGGVDVEWRISPALRGEDRPEQKRAPRNADTPRLGERSNPQRRRIGIGARELVPELCARHYAAPGPPASLSWRGTLGKSRTRSQRSRPIGRMGRLEFSTSIVA